jgi:hypothetical protein
VVDPFNHCKEVVEVISWKAIEQSLMLVDVKKEGKNGFIIIMTAVAADSHSPHLPLMTIDNFVLFEALHHVQDPVICR